MCTVQMSVEIVSTDFFAHESLEYHISDLKKNLMNSRSPAHVEDDKGSKLDSPSRFSVSYAHDLSN